MKLLYFYDDNNEILDDKTTPVTDEFIITTEKNATLVAPEPGLNRPAHFDEKNQVWVGADRVTPFETVAENNQPTTEQQQQAQILLTVAKNKADQDKINAQLLLALASNQIGGGQNG